MTGTPVPDPLSEVLGVLDLTPAGPDTFAGASLPQPGGRVFGGQVLAQALMAAGLTVDGERSPHSLHGYFLRAGDASKDITFAVERLRDGRSFTARRTHALQDGAPILSMITSFQAEQPGLEHAETMPAVPEPMDVASAFDTLGPVNHPVAKFWVQRGAFDLRHVDSSIYLGPASERTDQQNVWMRTRGTVDSDSQLLHRALIAYGCDQVLFEPIMRRHGESWSSPGLKVASLDHAMWWHRPARADEWLLYTQTSPSAHGGRGLSVAKVFDRDGEHVATIAQEGMIRLPD